MKIKVPVKDEDYFDKLVSLFSNIPPFSKLRPKGLELYAKLLQYNHRWSRLPFNERNTLIFSTDYKEEMAKTMGIELSGVYNLMKELKQAGIIEKDKLIVKYTLPKVKEVKFEFIEENEA